MTLAAVDLASRQSEMLRFEISIIAVVASQALRRHALGQQADKTARMRTMTPAAFILCRRVRHTLGDYLIDVFVTAQTQSRLLVEQEILDLSGMRFMTTRAFACLHRMMFADGIRRDHIRVALTAQLRRCRS